MEVDENGLWAIYGGDQRENDLMVAKLNAESLQVTPLIWVMISGNTFYMGNDFR